MPPWRLGHRPGLDGLRGLAILLVVACHVLDQFKPSAFHALGAAGVTVFFTLSGFLITSLLLQERHGAGRVSLRSFYARRALRLFPALAFSVIGFTLLSWWLIGFIPTSWPTLLYVANWVEAAGGRLPYFGPTWSLSIEEQFYILWPLALLASVKWRHGLVIVAVGGIVVSTVLRFSMYDGGAGSLRVYYGSDTEASTLLVGCLLAVLATRGLPVLAASWVIPLGVGLLSALAFIDPYEIGDVWVPTLVPLVAAAMIWTACHRPGILRGRVLRYVGRRSYAIYLWHAGLLALTSAPADWHPSVTSTVLGLAVTLLVAEFSWRLVEQPFLRLKRRASHSSGSRKERHGPGEHGHRDVMVAGESHVGGHEGPRGPQSALDGPCPVRRPIDTPVQWSPAKPHANAPATEANS